MNVFALGLLDYMNALALGLLDYINAFAIGLLLYMVRKKTRWVARTNVLEEAFCYRGSPKSVRGSAFEEVHTSPEN